MFKQFLMAGIACLLVVAGSAAASGVHAQYVGTTTVLGPLTGQSSPQRPRFLQLYGTDLGWTFEHKGELQILLGDSWSRPYFLCGVLLAGFPDHDDVQGVLPLEYSGGVPPLTVATKRFLPILFEPAKVYRGTELLRTSQNAGPMTAFSDGENAIAIYQATTFAPCSADGSRSCPDSLTCSTRVGKCQPELLGVPVLCNLDGPDTCYAPAGQSCKPYGQGYCVDANSGMVDAPQKVALELEVSVQRPQERTHYDSRHTFVSNKFINMTARTVKRFQPKGKSDYRPGHGDLLLWGRPGFTSDEPNNKPLYLFTHELPFVETGVNKAFNFHPHYFAGLDEAGQPLWSDSQADAKALALDGQPNGSPREVLRELNQLTVTWLDAPINRWVMFYGGDIPLKEKGPSTEAVGGVAPGAIAVRFAEHPWGPWSPPQTLLAPGTPQAEGTLYGPGGSLYHPSCKDSASQQCAQTDPSRYTALVNGSCLPEHPTLDYGVLYAPGIIEPYTKSIPGGFEVYWTASTWNPYITIFIRSQILASALGERSAR